MSKFGKEYVLSTPLSEEDVRQLKSGDILYIHGDIWSARTRVMKKFVDNHEPLPIDTSRLNVMITAGEGLKPVDKEHTLWDPNPFGSTMGLRFEKWFPGLIRDAGLRAVITKGNTGPGTREACVKHGCVQLSPFGWKPHFADVLKEKVKDSEIFWREGGMMEALIVYHLGNTGPWVVNVDTAGNVMYNNLYRPLKRRLKSIYRDTGIPEDFRYTSLDQVEKL
ncbi:MAG: fumarate hydratase C-terminal domain-containing protein [Chloroflexi bacterium]|nr:fumarate hydratase C-terminal domain-containing protein [Chloroflexota bacterium]